MGRLPMCGVDGQYVTHARLLGRPDIEGNFMSETPVDKSIDRKSNVVMFTLDQSQPDHSLVHNLLQDRPSTSLADALHITEKRPALRLHMQPGSNTLLKSKTFSTRGA